MEQAALIAFGAVLSMVGGWVNHALTRRTVRIEEGRQEDRAAALLCADLLIIISRLHPDLYDERATDADKRRLLDVLGEYKLLHDDLHRVRRTHRSPDVREVAASAHKATRDAVEAAASWVKSPPEEAATRLSEAKADIFQARDELVAMLEMLR